MAPQKRPTRQPKKAARRSASHPTPGLGPLDQAREASIADEGGASGAAMEGQSWKSQVEAPVMVATDLTPGSDEAVRQAHDVATSLGGPLVACHVLPEVPQARALFPNLWPRDEDLRARSERDVRQAVEESVLRLTGRSGTALRVVIAWGTPHAGILERAESGGMGLIVLGPGDAAERVARHATCAVLIARPSPPGRVLAATDLSDGAFPAIAAGAAESARRGEPLVVLHSVDLQPAISMAAMASHYPAVPMPSAQERDAVRSAVLAYLDETLKDLGAAGATVVAEGEAGPSILAAAHDLPAGIVVVGTTGRSGLSRLLLGSTAEKVIRHAPCSTLVVRLNRRQPPPVRPTGAAIP